jgi:hypothetical protein
MNHNALRPNIKKRSILEEIEKLPAEPLSPKKTEKPKPKTETETTSNKEFWTIPKVLYNNQVHVIDLSKSLLLDGEAHTQEEWSQHYNQSKPSDEFHTPDFPLLYSTIKTLKSAGFEEARQFLQEKARAHWLTTLTRIKYTPKGLDEIIHNYNTPDIYTKQVDFITPDEWIKETSNPSSYQALLDTTDSAQEINDLFYWLNQTNTRSWKVNSKPVNPTERVAWLNANSDRVNLSCYGVPANRNLSLGVRFSRAKN